MSIFHVCDILPFEHAHSVTQIQNHLSEREWRFFFKCCNTWIKRVNQFFFFYTLDTITEKNRFDLYGTQELMEGEKHQFNYKCYSKCRLLRNVYGCFKGWVISRIQHTQNWFVCIYVYVRASMCVMWKPIFSQLFHRKIALNCTISFFFRVIRVMTTLHMVNMASFHHLNHAVATVSYI